MVARPVTRRIGRWGAAARTVTGVVLILVAAVAGVGVLDAILGLVAFPVAVLGVLALRGVNAPPVRLTGPAGHCVNCGLIVAAFVVVPVAALLFYGASMLVAAVRGYAGCELFAVSNALLGRGDEIACPLFHPVDVAEARAANAAASKTP